MSELTEQFDSVYSDGNEEIAEKNSVPNMPVVAPTYRPIIKPLCGYEAIMRKHAAACEAGR